MNGETATFKLAAVQIISKCHGRVSPGSPRTFAEDAPDGVLCDVQARQGALQRAEGGRFVLRVRKVQRVLRADGLHQPPVGAVADEQDARRPRACTQDVKEIDDGGDGLSNHEVNWPADATRRRLVVSPSSRMPVGCMPVAEAVDAEVLESCAQRAHRLYESPVAAVAELQDACRLSAGGYACTLAEQVLLNVARTTVSWSFSAAAQQNTSWCMHAYGNGTR